MLVFMALLKFQHQTLMHWQQKVLCWINSLPIHFLISSIHCKSYVNAVCSPTRASLLSARSQVLFFFSTRAFFFNFSQKIHTGCVMPYKSMDDSAGLNLTYTLFPQHLKTYYNYSCYQVGKW